MPYNYAKMIEQITEDRFFVDVAESALRAGWLDEPDGWLAAVSGGADSMALLVVLAGLTRRHPLRVHVAHLNHQLRGAAADEDAAFVQEQAEKLHLSATVGREDVAALADAQGQSVETAARAARYAFLQRIAAEEGCGKIAVAHTADDQAETVLHRIVRGTGLAGLAGIPPQRRLTGGATVVRPLLEIRREEIESFLRRCEIPWREDASNVERTYTRNRIRHDLLPALREQYNPQVDDALRRLARISAEAGEFLEAEAQRLLARAVREAEEKRLVLDGNMLAEAPPALRSEAVRAALAKLRLGQRRIGFEQIEAVTGLLANGSAGRIDLPDGVRVGYDGKLLTIFAGVAAAPPFAEEIRLNLSGSTPVNGAVQCWLGADDTAAVTAVECQRGMIDAGGGEWQAALRQAGPLSEVLDADRLEGPLVLRCWRQGERFAPLGAAGGKTLGDFFSDRKVPEPVRGRLGLICDDAGIVCVLGLAIAARVRVRPETQRVVRLGVVVASSA